MCYHRAFIILLNNDSIAQAYELALVQRPIRMEEYFFIYAQTGRYYNMWHKNMRTHTTLNLEWYKIVL